MYKRMKRLTVTEVIHQLKNIPYTFQKKQQQSTTQSLIPLSSLLSLLPLFSLSSRSLSLSRSIRRASAVALHARSFCTSWGSTLCLPVSFPHSLARSLPPSHSLSHPSFSLSLSHVLSLTQCHRCISNRVHWCVNH